MFRVTRLRNFEETLLSYDECFVILHQGGRALELGFEQTSLMKELEDADGESFREKHQQIEAIVADTQLARLLDVALGTPAPVITRHYVNARGQPCVVFRSS